MCTNSMEAAVRRRFADVEAVLNERQRQLGAAAEADAADYGGASMVARATGISRRAIHAGLRELAGDTESLSPTRIRRPGGGRRLLTVQQPTLKEELDGLVEPLKEPEEVRNALRSGHADEVRRTDELHFSRGFEQVSDSDTQ
jgi:hypothetical protein